MLLLLLTFEAKETVASVVVHQVGAVPMLRTVGCQYQKNGDS